MKKILFSIFALAFVCFGLVACGHTHTFAEEWSKDANNHWHAATCEHTEEVEGKAAHTFGEWVETKAATEEEKGSKERTCSVCGYKETAEIDKLAHTHKFAEEWSKDENNHWHESTCGHDVKDGEAAHTFGEWTETLAATCGDKGSKERECTVCGYKETAEIEATGAHEMEDSEWENVEEATDDTPAVIGRKCSVCDQVVETKTLKSLSDTLELAEGEGSFCAAGQDLAWGYNEDGMMEFASINDIALLDAAVAAKLEAELNAGNLVAVAVVSGLELGTKVHAGWSVNALVDGKLYKYSGNFALKVINVTYDEDDETWFTAKWMPDPHTANVESLTPDMFFVPTWQEEADENGFEWSQNPVVLGGAGKYTVIFAQYKTPSDSTHCGYGMGVLLEEELEAGEGVVEGEEIVELVTTDHTWEVVGSMTSWDSDDDYAMAQTEAEDGTFQVVLALSEDDELKVRADGAWDIALGFAALDEESQKIVTDANGNIKISQEGLYSITLNPDGSLSLEKFQENENE
jgi:hypothetical protein